MVLNLNLASENREITSKFLDYKDSAMEIKSQHEVLKNELTESEEAKAQVQSKLNEETLKLESLNKENQTLKAELQAKLDRESRREANLYAPGNCTWYVKERVPHIGGTWGNANQWLASAEAYGYKTGYEPKPGAIGVSFEGYYGHVVYIEAVHDGVVSLSEMNAPILGAVTQRVAPSSTFKYIYV